jgi:hypothetical protein
MNRHEHYVGVTFPHEFYPHPLDALAAYVGLLAPADDPYDLVIGDKVMAGATVIWTEPWEEDDE